MGIFSQSVRANQIAGPHQRTFDRSRWLAASKDEALDAKDQALAAAGLYFDDLLGAIRQEKALHRVSLDRSDLIRLAIGIATTDMLALRDLSTIKKTPNKEEVLFVSDALQDTVTLESGDRFSPDELIGALGDGLKHLLRELSGDDTPSAATRLQQDALESVVGQLSVAVKYDVAVQHWLSIVGFGHDVVATSDEVVIRPANHEDEVARIASMYRRRNIVLHRFIALARSWVHRLPREIRETLHPIPTVTRLYGTDCIARIDLGWNRRAMFGSVFHIAERTEILEGPYRPFVDEPLPGLSGLSLRRLLDGWLLVQSIAQAMYDAFKGGDKTVVRTLRLAPEIPERVLAATVARALAVDASTASAVLDTLTFTGRRDQELWSNPLVKVGARYVIALPCVVMANLQRIADVWLRQGQIELSRKGADFEQYCVQRLLAAAARSVLPELVF